MFFLKLHSTGQNSRGTWEGSKQAAGGWCKKGLYYIPVTCDFSPTPICPRHFDWLSPSSRGKTLSWRSWMRTRTDPNQLELWHRSFSVTFELNLWRMEYRDTPMCQGSATTKMLSWLMWQMLLLIWKPTAWLFGMQLSGMRQATLTQSYQLFTLNVPWTRTVNKLWQSLIV